jgi:phospholipid transport system substrate-binding protein
MLRINRRTALLGGLLALGFGRAAASAGGTPTGVVESFYAVLLEVMKQAGSLGFDGRYRRLQPAVEAAFDLPLMIRLAIGPPWNALTDSQRDRLLEAFRRFTISTYAGRFDGYDGERFETRGEAPAQNGAVLVQTRLVPTSGDPVELNYLLHQADGGWRIIDVFLSGTISELATRRAEFTSVLRRDGADGLVTLIERKVAELKPR